MKIYNYTTIIATLICSFMLSDISGQEKNVKKSIKIFFPGVKLGLSNSSIAKEKSLFSLGILFGLSYEWKVFNTISLISEAKGRGGGA